MKKNNLWFKAKHYGWGWYPVTWQGWVVTLIWAILVFVSINLIKVEVHEVGKNIIIILLFTVILLWICYKKGEKPRWRWGK